MAAAYYLAVDIGASSGRHILCSRDENGRMQLEEIHRFENRLENQDGTLCWNFEKLFKEVKEGLKKCKEAGKIPYSMGIDTWGVDFVLLDKEDRVLGKTVAYRDHRTEGMDKEVAKYISKEELYARTGIQKQIFNTIYQMMAIKNNTPELLEQAESFLMVPDYFHFLLTGKKVNEYTNATTTQLVHAEQKTWDKEMIKELGYPAKLFGELSMPGTMVGPLREEIAKEVGFNLNVVLPPTHDTASAVLAMPTNSQNAIYLSSGTWSLMGIESMDANTSAKSRELNFTNEGGYEFRYRYLKNIMGLWMIQSVRHELGDRHSFAKLCDLARAEEEYEGTLDVNDPSFLTPVSMIGAIYRYCEEHNQEKPDSVGKLAKIIYTSLAKCYGKTVQEIEKVTKRSFDSLYVMGGGSKADYLNELTAKEVSVKVYAGPDEATAIGNLVAQMIAASEFADIWEARKCIFDSFNIREIKTK